MTDKLQEIRAREQAATPGPWTWNPCEGDCDIIGKCPKGLEECNDECLSCNNWVYHQGAMVPQVKTIDYGDFTDMNDADAEFIAHARTDIPALLAELAKVTAERDAAVKCIKDVELYLEWNSPKYIKLTIDKWRGVKESEVTE